MNILAIETSCDETGVALLSFEGKGKSIKFSVLGEKLFSQVDLHQEYGGVYPSLAKREHQKNLPILTHSLLSDLKLLSTSPNSFSWGDIKSNQQEENMLNNMKGLFQNTKLSNVDAMAVTYGPGLSPALWVGINFVKILSSLWGIPVIPVNHMEGHIISSFVDGNVILEPKYPVLSLLVSGGHTELVISLEKNKYEKIGSTLDDAAGEAFDKVARLLGLKYPGGPEISKLSSIAREKNIVSPVTLPRPMLKHNSLDFSYAGLKTSVRTYLEKNLNFTEEERMGIAKEFENAVIETLLKKTKIAIERYAPKSVVIAGGVSANNYLRESFSNMLQPYPKIKLFLPKKKLSTDNAVMIGLSAYFNKENTTSAVLLKANPKLSFPKIIS